MIGAILYWYTIVCYYLYNTFCYFSVIRILVRLFCYLALLCCAFSVISTIVLYVPRVEIKKGGLVTPPGGAAQALSSPQGLTKWDTRPPKIKIIWIPTLYYPHQLRDSVSPVCGMFV